MCAFICVARAAVVIVYDASEAANLNSELIVAVDNVVRVNCELRIICEVNDTAVVVVIDIFELKLIAVVRLLLTAICVCVDVDNLIEELIEPDDWGCEEIVPNNTTPLFKYIMLETTQEAATFTVIAVVNTALVMLHCIVLVEESLKSVDNSATATVTLDIIVDSSAACPLPRTDCNPAIGVELKGLNPNIFSLDYWKMGNT